MDALANSAARHADGWASCVGHAAWQGAVVGLVALAVVRLGRRWPAPLRYWILVLALFKFATPPLTSLPTGVFSLLSVRYSLAEPNGTRNSASSAVRNEQSPAAPYDGAETSPTSQPRPESSVKPANHFVGQFESKPKPGDANASAGAAPARSPLRWQAVLILMHLSGAAWVLALFAIRAIRLQASWRRMEQPSRELADTARGIARQLGLRRVPTLRISRDVQVPY